MAVMKIMVVEEMMAVVMERGEVMQVARMASCPVSGIEMMADARMPHSAVSNAAVGDSNMPAPGVRAHTAECMGRVSSARRCSHNMTAARMAHSPVADAAMNSPGMASAKVSANANRMTAAMTRASNVRATNMASPEMSAAVTNMSSVSPARVSAGMSASAVPTSMSSTMLRVEWGREKSGGARAQNNRPPD